MLNGHSAIQDLLRERGAHAFWEEDGFGDEDGDSDDDEEDIYYESYEGGDREERREYDLDDYYSAAQDEYWVQREKDESAPNLDEMCQSDEEDPAAQIMREDEARWAAEDNAAAEKDAEKISRLPPPPPPPPPPASRPGPRV